MAKQAAQKQSNCLAHTATLWLLSVLQQMGHESRGARSAAVPTGAHHTPKADWPGAQPEKQLLGSGSDLEPTCTHNASCRHGPCSQLATVPAPPAWKAAELSPMLKA